MAAMISGVFAFTLGQRFVESTRIASRLPVRFC